MSGRIEIYRTFVGTITANEARRQQSSMTYLGMVAAIATVSSAVPGLSLVWPIAVIFVVALTWLATVVYFRRLAQAKFAVIKEIEKSLEIAPFDLELQYFKRRKRLFSLSLTYIEMVLPIGIALGSIGYIAYWVVCHAPLLS